MTKEEAQVKLDKMANGLKNALVMLGLYEAGSWAVNNPLTNEVFDAIEALDTLINANNEKARLLEGVKNN